jgi:hypothetical protein
MELTASQPFFDYEVHFGVMEINNDDGISTNMSVIGLFDAVFLKMKKLFDGRLCGYVERKKICGLSNTSICYEGLLKERKGCGKVERHLPLMDKCCNVTASFNVNFEIRFESLCELTIRIQNRSSRNVKLTYEVEGLESKQRRKNNLFL